MNTLKRNMDKAGYNQEEMYFYQKEKEIRERRQERPKLELIEGGGKKEAPRSANEQSKKAA